MGNHIVKVEKNNGKIEDYEFLFQRDAFHFAFRMSDKEYVDSVRVYDRSGSLVPTYKWVI